VIGRLQIDEISAHGFVYMQKKATMKYEAMSTTEAEYHQSTMVVEEKKVRPYKFLQRSRRVTHKVDHDIH
jgi:hypothetical protein